MREDQGKVEILVSLWTNALSPPCGKGRASDILLTSFQLSRWSARSWGPLFLSREDLIHTGTRHRSPFPVRVLYVHKYIITTEEQPRDDSATLDEAKGEEHPTANQTDHDEQAEFERRYREQLSRMSCFGYGEEPL